MGNYMTAALPTEGRRITKRGKGFVCCRSKLFKHLNYAYSSKAFYDTSPNLPLLQTYCQLARGLLRIRHLFSSSCQPQLQFFYPLSFYPAPFPNPPQLTAVMNPAPLKVLDEGFLKKSFQRSRTPC